MYDKEIKRIINEKDGAFASTSEIAEKLDLTVNGARYHLDTLQEDGVVDSRVVSRDRIWHVSESGGKVKSGRAVKVDLANPQVSTVLTQ